MTPRMPARSLGAGLLLWGLALLAPSAALPQGTLSALETDVDLIARRARPAVVTVFAQSRVVSRGPVAGQPANRLHTRVGSGVAVGESDIVTTASVVLGAERVLIRTVNGIQVEARLVGIDPIFNVALLRAPDLKLPALKFAAHPAQIGDWVIALGTSYRAEPTQSVGNIAFHYREPRTSLLQLTNTVYPGNSGGAALNARGERVGIVQGELGSPDLGGSSPESERRPGGMSFVSPTGTIRPVVESLSREGRVRHGYLGVTTRLASVPSVSQPGTRVALGALVESVVPAGPAARSGIRSGDLIVAFERERVEYPEQLARWVAESRPGTSVDLVWVRNEAEQSGRVTLGESQGVAPDWALAARATGDHARISDIERQIRLLNRQLEQIKGSGGR
jgi:serine protease Do